MFYKDTAGQMESNNPHFENLGNKGFGKRHAFFENSRVVDMIGCVHADLFFQDKYLPSDVGLRLRLVRNKDAFCLMSNAANASYKIQIVVCKLFICKVKLSPSVFLAYAKAFEVGSAKYPIRRIICKTFTIPAGNIQLQSSTKSLCWSTAYAPRYRMCRQRRF